MKVSTNNRLHYLSVRNFLWTINHQFTQDINLFFLAQQFTVGINLTRCANSKNDIQFGYLTYCHSDRALNFSAREESHFNQKDRSFAPLRMTGKCNSIFINILVNHQFV